MHKWLRPLFYLVLIGLFIVAYQNNTVFQTTVDQGVANTQAYIGKWLNNTKSDPSDKANSPAQQKVVKSTSTKMSGHWKSNQATIYIKMNNASLQQAMEAGVNAWNSTGAFKFTVVSTKKDADIVATTENDQNNKAAGVTEMSQQVSSGIFVHGHVYLNEAYLLNPAYGYTYERIVNTAEHELGHAIGLNHTNDVSVMQPAGSFYSIQAADVEQVRQLYGQKQAAATSQP